MAAFSNKMGQEFQDLKQFVEDNEIALAEQGGESKRSCQVQVPLQQQGVLEEECQLDEMFEAVKASRTGPLSNAGHERWKI